MFQDFPRNLKGRRSPWGGVSLSCAKFGSSLFSVAPSYKKLCPYVCIYLLVGWSVGWLNRHKFGLSAQTGRTRRLSSFLYISYFPAFISYTYVFRCVRQERISIRGCVRPSVRPSVRRSIRPLRLCKKPRFSAVFGHGEILH